MSELTKIRVIVADDDTDILDLVLFKLTQAGTTLPWQPSKPTHRRWLSLRS